jgi:hypothetical protein
LSPVLHTSGQFSHPTIYIGPTTPIDKYLADGWQFQNFKEINILALQINCVHKGGVPQFLKGNNKTKVIRADLRDFYFYFNDIFKFGKISVLVTFQFW